VEIKVYKFGGTSLEGKERLKNAVASCAADIRKGAKVLCVVSAMGKTTDKLFNFVQETNPLATIDDSISIIGLGEIISARLFDYLLKREGVKSTTMEPSSAEWPIFLKKDGTLDRRVCSRKVNKYLPGLLGKFDCVVVPGFVGLKKDGSWGSLGRGGSDLTAFILGKFLGAGEIIIVKDVDGIFNADPRVFTGAKKLKYITADELSSMSSFGAKVIHSDALSFKAKNQKAKIVHFSFGNLAYEGTVVDGKVKRKLFILEEKLCLISIYKDEITGERKLIKAVTNKVLDVTKIFGITLGIDYLGFYVPSSKSPEVLEKLGEISNKKGFSLIQRNDIALLIMKRESAVNLPGMINYLLTPLSKKGINIVETITIGREILVFVKWEDRNRAMDALKRRKVKK